MSAESKCFEQNPFIKRAIAAATIVAAGTFSLAGCGASGESGVGNDVSYPQCDPSNTSATINLPNEHSFAIVGLNNGIPMSENPCFEAQMVWAETASGDTSLPKASIYVNSGNPGKANAANWPSSGQFQGISCKGEDTEACAFSYGQKVAETDLSIYKTKSGQSHNQAPQNFICWMDTEVGNNWQCNKGMSDLCGDSNVEQVQSGALSRNAAVLNGMAAVFKSNDIKVGIYTNTNQLNKIIDNTVSKQPDKYAALSNVPVWLVSGAHTKEEAQVSCTQHEFGGLGKITISQAVSANQDIIDKDVVC